MNLIDRLTESDRELAGLVLWALTEADDKEAILVILNKAYIEFPWILSKAEPVEAR